jgi:hypothetical protein
VRGDDLLLRSGSFGVEHDMATYLPPTNIAPTAAEVIGQLISGEVAWEFHARAKTSSFLRWRRMVAGLG